MQESGEMKSILQTEKECFMSRKLYGISITEGVYPHHIYFGKGLRMISDKNGFYIYLKSEYHLANSLYDTPHNNREIDLFYKKLCQKKYEETHTREDFIKLIGRNYLD